MTAFVEKSVIVIDPNYNDRRETVRTLTSAGFEVREYADGETLLHDIQDPDRLAYFCVVSELNLPGLDGLLLQRELTAGGHIATMIFFTRDVAVRRVVRAMREGAIAVVDKRDGPVSLQHYVDEAIEASRMKSVCASFCRKTIGQLRELTPGERDVVHGIMAGKLNKEIAHDLNVATRTVEQRRRRAYHKLDVQHPASLACKLMRFVQIQESQPQFRDDEVVGWLTERRFDGPAVLHSWLLRQAYSDAATSPSEQSN